MFLKIYYYEMISIVFKQCQSFLMSSQVLHVNIFRSLKHNFQCTK